MCGSTAHPNTPTHPPPTPAPPPTNTATLHNIPNQVCRLARGVSLLVCTHLWSIPSPGIRGTHLMTALNCLLLIIQFSWPNQQLQSVRLIYINCHFVNSAWFCMSYYWHLCSVRSAMACFTNQHSTSWNVIQVSLNQVRSFQGSFEIWTH